MAAGSGGAASFRMAQGWHVAALPVCIVSCMITYLIALGAGIRNAVLRGGFDGNRASVGNAGGGISPLARQDGVMNVCRLAVTKARMQC